MRSWCPDRIIWAFISSGTHHLSRIIYHRRACLHIWSDTGGNVSSAAYFKMTHFEGLTCSKRKKKSRYSTRSVALHLTFWTVKENNKGLAQACRIKFDKWFSQTVARQTDLGIPDRLIYDQEPSHWHTSCSKNKTKNKTNNPNTSAGLIREAYMYHIHPQSENDPLFRLDGAFRNPDLRPSCTCIYRFK